MNVLKEQVTLLKQFLRSTFKFTLLVCSVAFLIIGIASYFIGMSSPDTVNSVMSSFYAGAKSSGAISADGGLSVFPLIANNWRVMILSALTGAIPFLFLPMIILASNAYVIGLGGAMFSLAGLSLPLFFVSILPHGIFEIPAMLLSFSCGIHLCLSLIKLIAKTFRREPMGETLSNLLRVMLLVVAPLTIIAAFVETYITPVIIDLCRNL